MSAETLPFVIYCVLKMPSYPIVETAHEDNICRLVFAPLRIRDPARAQYI